MADDGVKRLAVILGAGSSYDCGFESDVDPEWRPPLVGQLFANRNSTFNPILSRYRRAESFAHEIRSEVRKGTEAFEKNLGSFAHSPDVNVRRAYAEVPFYLQELLGEVSSK